MDDKDISRFISLILRHRPEAAGVTLDGHGWADVDELIRGVNRTHPLTKELLEKIGVICPVVYPISFTKISLC